MLGFQYSNSLLDPGRFLGVQSMAVAQALKAQAHKLATIYRGQRLALRRVFDALGLSHLEIALQRANLALRQLLGARRGDHDQCPQAGHRHCADCPRFDACHHCLPLLSRSGRSHPAGKLVEMPHMRVSEETLNRLRALAQAEAIPLSEFVRTLLDTRAYGSEHVESLSVQRIRRVVGIGPASWPRP